MTGVFGGTFDPPHLAHLILADCARTTLGLDRVLWVLTPTPPHKPGAPITPVELREQMLALTLEADPGFVLSRADLDRDPPHYAAGTMATLRSQHPDRRWAYLMGADSLADLPTWHRPVQFVERCDLIGVMPRPGVLTELDALSAQIPGLAEKVRFLDAPLVGISARVIRKRVRSGQAYRYLVHPEVAAFILSHKVYQEQTP
jgi:nicotinate-nucleotide adenylyltransferase